MGEVPPSPTGSTASLRVLLAIPPGSSHYCVPPLGLGYLAGSLRKWGFPGVRILDGRDGSWSPRAFLAEAMTSDVLGLSLYSLDVPLVVDLVRKLRSQAPHLLIVAGGPHPTARGGDTFLEVPGLHGVFVGEAEKTLPQVLGHWFAQGVLPERIPGFGGNGRCILPPERIQDLDDLPLPAWDLMPPASYAGAPQGAFFRGFPIAPVTTTRGCPYLCTYCASHLTMGRRPRTRSIPAVMAEIRYLTEHFGVKEFHIIDDAFSLDECRVLAFAEEFARLGPGFWFTFPNGLRLDTLTRQGLQAMKDAGLHSPTIGIESGSQRILDAMRKGLTLDQIREKVHLLAALGLHPNGFFLLGFPGETRADIEATIRFACELPLRRAHFSNFLPLPGTEISRLIDHPHSARCDFASLHYAREPYVPCGFRPGELKHLQKRAYRRFYLRPTKILALLEDVRSLKQLGGILARMMAYAL